MNDFITRIHIANAPVGAVQECFRCNTVLLDFRNCAWPDGQEPPRFWKTGAFIGVTESANGLKMNPVCSVVMDHDAIEFDEVKCID